MREMPMDLALEVVHFFPGKNAWLTQCLKDTLKLLPVVELPDSAEEMDGGLNHEDAIDFFRKREGLLETFLGMIDGQRRPRSIMRYAISFNIWRVQRKLLKEVLVLRKEFDERKFPKEVLVPSKEFDERKFPKEVLVPSKEFDERKHKKTMRPSQSPQCLPLSMMIDESKIVGFVEHSKTLEEQLIIKGTEDFHPRNALCVVSIKGKHGSGKTTLARALYNSADIKNHFQVRVWVLLSPDLSPTDLLLSILNAVDGRPSKDFNERNANDDLLIENMMRAVKESLWDRRFLIVLDDVRDPEVWLLIILECVFPNNRNGSRVMITTQDSNWGNFIHRLQPLNEEDSWLLFLKKWGCSQEDSQAGQLKERIYEKTGGLPLTIVMLGGLLSRRANSLDELSKVIEDHQFWDSIGDEFNLLETNYTDLPRELKLFFLYAGIFPREFEIPVRRLCGLWSAEGYQNLNDLNIMIKELSEKSLIEVRRLKPDGTPKTCRMSATIHDFAVKKAEEVRHYRVHSSAQSLQPPERMVRRLAEWVDTSGTAGKPSYKVDHFRYLRSYLSFNFQKGDQPEEQAGKLIHEIVRANRGFGLLRVLDLERVYKPSLPESLGKLFNLRYLGLRWTFIDTLPSSVGDLTCLETLDVKHTLITHLPPSIWKMQQLRHLYLSDTRLDRVPRKSLAELETLWGLFVDEKSCLTDGLTNLTKLGLTCRRFTNPQGDLSNWILKMKKLQSLRLRSLNRSGQPSDLSWLAPFTTDHSDLSDLYLTGSIGPNVNEFPPNLRMLTLSASNLEEDPMVTLGQLKSLTVLRLFGNAYTGRSMSCLGFPELRVMKLWKQENLEEWNVEEGAMPKLKKLSIRLCDKLKKFPVGLTQNRKVELKLILKNMPEEFVKAAEDKKGNGFAVIVNKWKESSPTTVDEAT